MTFTVPNRKIVHDDGASTTDFLIWMNLVSNPIIFGTGNPETVVEANKGRLYMDENGVSGGVLYIKQQADIAGDRKQGWVAV